MFAAGLAALDVLLGSNNQVNSIDKFDLSVLQRSQLTVFARSMNLFALHTRQDTSMTRSSSPSSSRTAAPQITWACGEIWSEMISLAHCLSLARV